MRVCRLSWVLVVWLVVSACASSVNKQPIKVPRETLTKDVRALCKEAELLFRQEHEKLDEVRAELLQTANGTAWWTRTLILYARGSRDRYLKRLRKDPDGLHRGEAVGFAKAVAELQRVGPAAVPTIVQELFRHKQKANRDLGVDLIGGMGPQVLTAIQPALKSGDKKLRRLAVRGVAKMESAEATQAALLKATGDADFVARAAAFAGLAKAGRKYLPRLYQAARSDRDPYVQRKAIEALAPFKDRATANVVVDYFEKAVQRRDRDGLRSAERTLWHMSGSVRRLKADGWRAWASELPKQ